MSSSPTFRVILRLVGVAGICVGGILVLAAFAFLMSKSPEIHTTSLIIGLVLIAISIYLACGAPHLVRVIERRDQRGPNDP
jgi:poly(3-hydroxyalkanoate) synthetase